MSKTLKGLVLFSACNLVSASIGAILSIALHLPARFGGLLSGNDVLQDFLFLNGTALPRICGCCSFSLSSRAARSGVNGWAWWG